MQSQQMQRVCLATMSQGKKESQLLPEDHIGLSLGEGLKPFLALRCNPPLALHCSILAPLNLHVHLALFFERREHKKWNDRGERSQLVGYECKHNNYPHNPICPTILLVCNPQPGLALACSSGTSPTKTCSKNVAKICKAAAVLRLPTAHFNPLPSLVSRAVTPALQGAPNRSEKRVEALGNSEAGAGIDGLELFLKQCLRQNLRNLRTLHDRIPRYGPWVEDQLKVRLRPRHRPSLGRTSPP